MKKNKILLKTALIIAPLCLPALSSCSKENATEESGPEGVRVISVQFGKTTKAAFGTDGVTPNFAEGDKIRVSDGVSSEVCAVSVDGDGNATFTTTLSGELRAIYPSEAAALTGAGRFDPIVSSSPRFKVPASQDGTIAKAIIAEATIAEGSSEAVFDGQTALFEITPPAGVTSFTITSLKAVGYPDARSGTAAPINTTGTTEAARLVIKVTAVPSGGKAYVALVPGVKLTDLSFDAGETYGMKGIPAGKLGTNPDVTVANMKYTVDAANWHPYLIIGGLKWATMNVGATSETDRGYHFGWGYAEGCVWNDTKWVLASDGTDWGFPCYQRFVADFKDTALANWGGAWRMFRSEANGESVRLTDACRTDSSSGNFAPTSTGSVPASKGVYYYNVAGSEGLYCVNGEGKKLFFPVGGYAKDGAHNNPTEGWYWSSIAITKTDGGSRWSNDFIFSESSVIPSANNSRGCGMLIRPVADL